MNPADEDLSVLANAVKTPTPGLTAVEIDTEAHAREVVEHLQQSLPSEERPSAVVSLQPTGADAAAALLSDAREAVRSWPSGQGVLYLVQPDRISDDAADRKAFWRELNLQREAWGALGCHVIFFLQPGSYSDLLCLADHLADWMPLKLRLLKEDESSLSLPISFPEPILLPDSPSPAMAREELARLEHDLAEALSSPNPPTETALIRRFYLPMLRDAVGIMDLRRAKALSEKVDEKDVPQANLPALWVALFELHYHLRDLKEAEKQANTLRHWAEDNGDQRHLAQALHQLGVIAQEQRDFAAAETWYLHSLEINEKSGNDPGAGGTYHQLGVIAQEQRDFAAAETWYRRSLEINERYGNEPGAAITYHQLGRIAQEQWDFAAAETWYRRSLEIKEKLGDEHGAALTLGQLGILSGLQGKFEETAIWSVRSVKGFLARRDANQANQCLHNFMIFYRQADEPTRAKMAAIWNEAGLEPIESLLERFSETTE